jgi:uncharacterized membrane protein
MTFLVGALGGALLISFLITVLELTEVVAIVYALGAGRSSLRPGALGSASGVAVVGAVGLVVGIGLSAIPSDYTLIVGSALLWGFGFFLLRSTVKTYFKEAKKARGIAESGGHEGDEHLSDHALFAAAFSVGMVETTEAVIVLVAVAAGGYGLEALLGFAAGAALLFTLGVVLHERIRRIKVPPLKWVGTSLLFTFAAFWAIESLVDAGRLAWPSLPYGVPPDVLLLPLFLMALGLVRVAVSFRVRAKIAALAAPHS